MADHLLLFFVISYLSAQRPLSVSLLQCCSALFLAFFLLLLLPSISSIIRTFSFLLYSILFPVHTKYMCLNYFKWFKQCNKFLVWNFFEQSFIICVRANECVLCSILTAMSMYVYIFVLIFFPFFPFINIRSCLKVLVCCVCEKQCNYSGEWNQRNLCIC